MVYEFFRKIVWLVFHIKYSVTVLHKENAPHNNGVKGGFIVACNHQSYSDPPLVSTAFKGHFSFMAKSELFKNKFFGWIISRCGAFPVVRGAGDNSAIDRAISDLEEKKRIFVIFPEGTRSKDGTIGRAKSGVALIAGKANAPVVPVCIKYGEKKFRQKVYISIGELIPKEAVALNDDDRTELRRVSNLIMNNIKALMEEMNADIKTENE